MGHEDYNSDECQNGGYKKGRVPHTPHTKSSIPENRF